MPPEIDDVQEAIVADSDEILELESAIHKAVTEEVVDDNYFEEVGLDDLFENITLEHGTGVDADQHLFDVDITVEHKAATKASQLITDFDLSTSLLDFLTDLFTLHRYPSTKAAIERFFERGGTEDEFRLAVDIRKYWSVNTGYSQYYSYTKATRGATHVALPWITTQRFIGCFNGVPDIAEVQIRLASLYEKYTWGDVNKNQYRSFAEYINYRVVDNDRQLSQTEWREFTEIPSQYGEEVDVIKQSTRNKTLGQILDSMSGFWRK